MRTPEDKTNAIPGVIPAIRYIYDYERCTDLHQLHLMMERINQKKYQLISVTQDSEDVYTVFFRRCAVG